MALPQKLSMNIELLRGEEKGSWKIWSVPDIFPLLIHKDDIFPVKKLVHDVELIKYSIFLLKGTADIFKILQSPSLKSKVATLTIQQHDKEENGHMLLY